MILRIIKAGWLSPGGYSSGGRALTALSQRPSVQSRVAAGFSEFLQKIFKAFSSCKFTLPMAHFLRLLRIRPSQCNTKQGQTHVHVQGRWCENTELPWMNGIRTYMYAYVHVYVIETHQTRQGNTTPPPETAHFLFFSKKK